MAIFLVKVVIISKNLCNFALRKRTDGKNEAYCNDETHILRRRGQDTWRDWRIFTYTSQVLRLCILSDC